MINWKKVRKDWETSDITLSELANKYDIKIGTLKSRKSREGWTREVDATNATPKKKRVATKAGKEAKNPLLLGNQNAKGNRGNPNPKCRFSERNTHALKHGLFSRYIPKETLTIMGMMENDEPADLIWDQIMIQYAAIVRAQQIMYVQNEHDTIKELKRVKVDNGVTEDGRNVQIPIEQEYEIQFAWDRHATFMNAQSRAMGELRSMIKQFESLAFESDERRLKLSLMTEQIEKLKREGNPDTSTEDKLKEYFGALGSAFSE